jgi:hypothetical protein
MITEEIRALLCKFFRDHRAWGAGALGAAPDAPHRAAPRRIAPHRAASRRIAPHRAASRGTGRVASRGTAARGRRP